MPVFYPFKIRRGSRGWPVLEKRIETISRPLPPLIRTWSANDLKFDIYFPSCIVAL